MDVNKSVYRILYRVLWDAVIENEFHGSMPAGMRNRYSKELWKKKKIGERLTETPSSSFIISNYYEDWNAPDKNLDDIILFRMLKYWKTGDLEFDESEETIGNARKLMEEFKEKYKKEISDEAGRIDKEKEEIKIANGIVDEKITEYDLYEQWVGKLNQSKNDEDNDGIDDNINMFSSTYWNLCEFDSGSLLSRALFFYGGLRDPLNRDRYLYNVRLTRVNTYRHGTESGIALYSVKEGILEIRFELYSRPDDYFRKRWFFKMNRKNPVPELLLGQVTYLSFDKIISKVSVMGAFKLPLSTERFSLDIVPEPIGQYLEFTALNFSMPYITDEVSSIKTLKTLVNKLVPKKK